MAHAIHSYEQLEEEVLLLPSQDRSKLASRLLDSLEEDDSGLSPEWEEEIQRRIKSIEDGTAKMIPAEDVWKDINQRFGTNF